MCMNRSILLAHPVLLQKPVPNRFIHQSLPSRLLTLGFGMIFQSAILGWIESIDLIL
jgi:hypothetical protein